MSEVSLAPTGAIVQSMSPRRRAARPGLLGLLGPLLALLVLCAACTWTMSAQRQRRISDCLAQCGASQGGPGGAPLSDGQRDTRSDCERRCHALK